MRHLIGALRKYLKGKQLELNIEKSKIIGFKKGGGREKERFWWWGEERIEEVKEIKYNT